MHPAQFLRRKQTGAYLREKFGVGSAASLAKYACLGGGPPMSYINRRIPVYTTGDLDVWALSRISAPVRNTSERRTRAT